MSIITKETWEELSLVSSLGESPSRQEKKKIVNALALYLRSIKADDLQPEWIYGNSIILLSKINRLDIGIKLKEKAEGLYPDSDEIARAIALFYEKQNQLQDAIRYYQKSIKLNPLQPKWVYTKLYNFLLETELPIEAEIIKQQGLKYFSQSFNSPSLATEVIEAQSNQTNIDKFVFERHPTITETSPSIEHDINANIEKKRQLMNSNIVGQYETILEQSLCYVDDNEKKIKPDALIHCLAKIKTEIDYLKANIEDSNANLIDPRAREITDSYPAVAVECRLRNPIVGSGWHTAEKHGRWTGSGTLSSVVLPYPVAGKYWIEIVVRSEAKLGLLKTLKLSLNDRSVPISHNQEATTFPTVIREEITIEPQNSSFLSIYLILDETVNSQTLDTKQIGLLIERISLIPVN